MTKRTAWAQRLVVGDDEEVLSLKHQPEVPDGCLGCQQLPVDGTVVAHCQHQLVEKEGERGPFRTAKVLQDCSNVCGGGIDHEGDWEVLLRMFALSSSASSVFASRKACSIGSIQTKAPVGPPFSASMRGSRKLSAPFKE